MSERTRNLVVLAAAVAVAAASARPFADSANDGSRLAVVESVVDHGTLSIDRSIFVRVRADRPPYPDHHDTLLEIGTIDRIQVGGRYYSDKPYTLSLYLAGCYWLLQRTTGLVARDDPALFCYLMTLFSSGVAYVVTVWCVWRLGAVVGLAPRWQAALVVVFGLGSLALPYCRHVNSHILGLAVASAIMLHLARFSTPSPLRGEGVERSYLPVAL